MDLPGAYAVESDFERIIKLDTDINKNEQGVLPRGKAHI